MEDSQVAAALSTQLAERIGQQRFDLWFNLQAQLGVRGASLTIRAASAFVRDWLRTHFADDIRICWEAIVGGEGTVEFDLDPALAQAKQNRPDEAALPSKPRPTSRPKRI